MSKLRKGSQVLLFSTAIALLATAAISPEARAQTPSSGQQEQAAIDVVKAWFAAWQDGDADKMASYMSDNVEFRGVPNQPVRIGREAFLQNTGRFIKLKPRIRITQTVAIGGVTDTAVLARRVDTITLNGQTRTVPLAAFFRVHDGKIDEWLDMPLIPLGGPPGGRAGAGNPPAGNAGAN